MIALNRLLLIALSSQQRKTLETFLMACSLNTKYLKVLYDAHKMARKYNSSFKKTMGVTLEATSEHGAIIATPDGIDYITAVLMPMRV